MTKGLKFIYSLQLLAKQYRLTFGVTYQNKNNAPFNYYFVYGSREKLRGVTMEWFK